MLVSGLKGFGTFRFSENPSGTFPEPLRVILKGPQTPQNPVIALLFENGESLLPSSFAFNL